MTNLPSWSSYNLLRHFRKHGHQLGLATVLDYEQSSIVTIVNGKRFTYDESGTPRVGYFDRRTGRLTVVSDDERVIITHFAPSGGERYCRNRSQSTY